jgi:glycosyltransferase involved in cell wall biosynthesis
LQVAVVHGYFLHDSGSGVYVRELAQELVRLGHDVSLVCQERSPELYDFIDSYQELDETNGVLRPPVELRPRRHPGSCRLVRPHLGGRLLVYVDGPFPGFEPGGIRPLQEAPTGWIEEYAAANARALRTVFAARPPDVVLAHHAVMQPYVAREALRGSATPYSVTVHGSELNFSIRRDARLVPYARAGLADAAAVVAVSEASAADVVRWSRDQGLEIGAKTVAVSPGVDMSTFVPAADKQSALDSLTRELPWTAKSQLSPADDILAFAGRVLWTKGIQHAVAALALVARRRPRARLLVAGYGPAREPAEELALLFGRGDLAGARRLAAEHEELRTDDRFGAVVPDSMGQEVPLRRSEGSTVTFLGHLTSTQLASVFAAADVALAPSVFPEAVGLVTVEALAAGASPVAAYHSGLTSVVDVVARELNDEAFRRAAPGTNLTEELAGLVLHVLEHYPTADPGFRRRLHELATRHFPSWRQVALRHLGLAKG